MRQTTPPVAFTQASPSKKRSPYVDHRGGAADRLVHPVVPGQIRQTGLGCGHRQSVDICLCHFYDVPGPGRMEPHHSRRDPDRAAGGSGSRYGNLAEAGLKLDMF